MPCDIKIADIDVDVVNKALKTLCYFPFFSDFLGKNAIDLENSFFFKSKWIVFIEMKCVF